MADLGNDQNRSLDTNNSVPVKPGGCPTAAGLTRSVDSQALFGDAKTVLIQHRGEQYRLIETKNGKLLLQK